MPYGTIKVDNITFTNGGSDSTITVSGIVEAISGNITATGTIQGATIIGTSTVSGATVTGNTASFTSGTFVSGIFTTQISGATITGNTGNFTTFNAGTANLTSGVFASGTQGAPSLSIGTATNGLYSPGADQVAISTGGSGRLFVDASGNVGVGTTPTTRFHVYQAGSTQAGLVETDQSASVINFKSTGQSSGQPQVGCAASDMILNTNGSERLRITSTGTVNIVGAGSAGSTQAVSFNGSAPVNSLVLTSGGLLGVGTNSPVNSLTAFGTQAAPETTGTGQNGVLRVGSSGSTVVLDAGVFQAGAYSWIQSRDSLGYTANYTLALNPNGGNVGIGTSVPDNAIHVSAGSASVAKFARTTNEGIYLSLSRPNKTYIAALDINNNGGKDFTLYDATAAASRITVTDGGSVGIGTIDPEDRLDLGSGYLRFKEAIGGTGTYGAIRAFNTLVNTTPATSIRFIRDVANVGNDGAICFDTVNSERARIDSSGTFTVKGVGTAAFSVNGGAPNNSLIVDSSGRCLVGTSSARTVSEIVGGVTYTHQPNFQLESPNGSLGISLITNRSADTTGPFITLGKSRGNALGGVTVVQNGDELGNIYFAGADGTDIECIGAAIFAEVDGDPGANDMPGRLVFSTTADGASSPTERMRITNAGQVNVYGSGTQGFLLAQFGSNYPARVYEAGAAGQNNAATQLNLHQNSATGRSINAAGTINASGADYAEYMVKASDFTIAKGAVCGVTADGLLTLNYADAVSFVVKSTNPSYVGGDTWGSEDVVGSKPEADDADALVQWEADLEASRQTVDRIAFAGQVPVNVMGATPGQYIVPVEAADGGIEGVAKNETDMTLAEYMRAVGKVIAIEDDGRARIIVKVA